MKDPTLAKATQDLKAELDASAKLLQELRDEVRVKIHLGSLDAKDEWRRLEPRLEATLDRAKKEVTDTSRAGIVEVTSILRRLRQALS